MWLSTYPSCGNLKIHIRYNLQLAEALNIFISIFSEKLRKGRKNPFLEQKLKSLARLFKKHEPSTLNKPLLYTEISDEDRKEWGVCQIKYVTLKLHVQNTTKA